MSRNREIAERSRAALVRTKKSIEENRADLTRKATAVGTSFALGSLTQTGKITSIPTAFGIPRTAMLAIVANVGALMMDKNSTLKNVLDGAGEGALCVAAFQFGMGQSIAGMHETDVHDSRDAATAARALEMATERRLRDDRRNKINALRQRAAQQQYLS